MDNQNLFSSAPASGEPLAARMRPRSLDEYIGQDHILGKGRLLRRAIQMDQLSSVIFYGPPGTGKTTLAKVIANTTRSHFSTMNAVLSGVKELREEIEGARNRRDHWGMRTILFVDEVHRWNKSQQDALLPWVENGTFILIGATTENPYFEVNKALVSRSRVFQLKKLTEKNLTDIALQAISDKERGYGKYKVEFEKGALEHLVDVAGGDARSLLNALELAVETTPEHFPPEEGERIFITCDTAEESIQKKAVLYDKEGDYHFDVISAFIKSIRGSDPDASLYWLSRMVAAGEDPRFIFRRMMISACEDVGLADPGAIVVVEADAAAFDRIGLPEGRFHLAHAALYLATCPKSNSTLGFFDALSDVEKEKDNEVPNHLKDPSRDSKGFGHGEGYLYPHSYKDHWVAQQYLPSALQGKIYYKPSSVGYEGKIRDEVMEKREAQLEAVGDDLFQENLTFSPGDRKRSSWIDRAMGERAGILRSLVNKLYQGVCVPRHGNVLVLNGSHGLLLYPLMKMNPEGSSLIQVRNSDEKAVIDHFSSTLEELLRPQVYVSQPESVFALLEEGLVFTVISGRNVLSRLSQDKAVLSLALERLEENGTLCLMEAIPSLSSRLSHFAGEGLKEKMEKAEKEIYSPENPLAGWGKEDLEREVRAIFPSARIEYQEIKEERRVTNDDLEAWWRNTYSRFGIEREEYFSGIGSGVMVWKNTVALINTNPGKEKRRGDEHKEVVEKVKGL